LLKSRLGMLEYGEALGVVVIIIIFITAMEFLSAAVRSLLLGSENIAGVAGAPRFSLGNQLFSVLTRRRNGASAVSQPTRDEPTTTGVSAASRVLPPLDSERRQKLMYSFIFVGLLAISWFAVDFSPLEFFTSLGDIVVTAGRFLPPDFSEIGDALVTGMLESIAIAIVSTFLGTVLSFPLGLLAARNVTVNKFVYGITRLVLLIIRGVPELIIAVIFVAAIGLGPIAGVFALTVGTAGFFAKLIADVLEEVDRRPREAVFATGATRMQEIATSVVPPSAPTLVGLFLYILDINIRTSTVLGIVGGGGIGFLLFNSIRVLEFQATGAIILTIFLVVYAVELLSMYIRKQIQ
ncbi:MAG: phosphonate ABC transporter, permease protein PhnE, partial [Actinomycetota bacterium]|nr:phosphonate ABC transporter, permease protein PhnE [Actinomycetota bacterium]